MRFGVSYICMITNSLEVCNYEDLSNRSLHECLNSIKEEYPTAVEIVSLEKPYKTLFKK